jgi:RecB family endonuclease NucS
MEKNLEPLLSIRFLASEYSTGKTHRGRIDTLGIDENGCPVIIEYKRALNENVINQGLFGSVEIFNILIITKVDNCFKNIL